ncbi:uncharacterized protein LOC134712531 isoform X2 [Mytilus trossulus]|uniref:uncharacterized protein LOC134712531 isoform X2 n=1 Tax=Mytilus trossulus TaxID=6551 RepID=UPI0030045BAF
MTHTGIDLDILKQKVKGIVNLRKEQYEVANVTESELMRTKLAFSFYLSKEMGYKQKEKFEQDIKASWIKKMKGSLTSNNTEVTVNRYTKYIDIATKKTVWKVDYYLKKDGSLVDPSVTSMLTDLHLNFTDASGHSYTILQPTNVVESKMGYKIFINREVRIKDIDKMKSVLVRWWKSTNNIDNKTVVHVDIPEQTQVLSGNKKYTMLSIFVKKEKTYVDSGETKDVNPTKIQSLIDFNGVNNAKYTVHTVTNYKRLDTAFSMYLSKAIKRTEVTSVINEIKKTWKEKVFTDTKLNVSVVIGSQDWYLYKSLSKKKVSKISYYLTVDGKAIHPDQVPEQDIKVPGRISPGPGLYSYNSLFHVDFTLPVLKTDIINMEKGLKAAWGVFRTDLKQTKTEIVHQEEMISSTGVSLWRIWYRITSNNTTVSPVQEDSVTSSTLQTKLNVTRTGSSMLQYGKLVKTTTESVFEYDNLLKIHFMQRIANSDHTKVGAKLLVLWKKKIGTKVKSVEVLKQEETIYSTSNTLWELSYHITTSDGTIVNSQYDATPSFKEYNTMGAVSNPLSEPYFIMNVDAHQTCRLTQAFKVMLNRRIYNVDREKFESVVKQTLAKKLKASNVSDITLVVFNEQKVVTIVSNSSKTVWRYNYIVNVSGTILNAAEEGGITKQHLQQEINFTSPRQQEYTVMEYDISTVSYSDLFRVHFFGIVPNDKKSSLMNHVKLYWENVTAYSNIELSSVSREDTFENITGKSLTTFTFIVTAGGNMMYPSLTKRVVYNNMVVPEVQVFPGFTGVTRYSWCFKLVLQSQHKPINKTVIKTLLENAWNASKQGYLVRVISIEQSVGDLGIHLTSVLYGAQNIREGTVHPDMVVEPDTKIMRKEAEKLKIQGKQYSAAEYRINTLFTASVRYENTMTVADNQNVENMLNHAVANTTKDQLQSIKTHVLLKKDYVSSSNTSVKIAKLYFKLEINNTTRKLWETSLATLKYKLDNQLDPKVQTDTTSIPQRKVYVLYLKGKVQKTEKHLLSALENNWMAVALNKPVVIKVIDTILYVDASWNIVTKVRYIVSINDTDPESKGINPPKYTALNVNLTQCGCSATSLKKHYVYSKTINSTRVRTAISTVWNGANKGLCSTALSVRVKQQSRRQKRDTHTSHKLVDGNGKEVTPMEYTVAVEDEEPQPLFVNIPSNNDIKAPLKQAGSEPCLCKPKLAGSLQLDGQTQDADKPKIVDAIKDAFVKENPDVTKPDLDVTVTGINNKAKDKDGNPVSEVSYRVGRKSDDVEDLKSPSTAHLQQSLATAGKTLHSRAPKDEDEDKKWTLPLAIALGILAAVIVIAIICCCIHKRRLEKKYEVEKLQISNTERERI